MGNVCGVVRYAIDYVLRYILPRNTSYFPRGYNTIIEQDITSLGALDIKQESENLLIKDSDSTINTERDQIYETTENTNLLLDIVSNFFNSYNFQMQVVSGRTYEKNLKNKGKYVEKLSPSWQHSNRHEAVKESRPVQPHSNRHEAIKESRPVQPNSNRDEAVKESRPVQPNSNIAQDFISGFSDVKVDAANSENIENENTDGSHHFDISVQNGRRSTKEHFHGTESSNENAENETKCNVNLSSRRN